MAVMEAQARRLFSRRDRLKDGEGLNIRLECLRAVHRDAFVGGNLKKPAICAKKLGALRCIEING